MDKLTWERLIELLDYEPKSGQLTWRLARGKARAGMIAGTLSNGYVLITIDRVMYKAHRLAWLHYYGKWPTKDIDHRNGVRSDNSIKNLREVTDAQNSQNVRRPHKDSICGLQGVVRNPPGFSARIMVRGKHIHLGTFATPEAAHAAYVRAKNELHIGA